MADVLLNFLGFILQKSDIRIIFLSETASADL